MKLHFSVAVQEADAIHLWQRKEDETIDEYLARKKQFENKVMLVADVRDHADPDNVQRLQYRSPLCNAPAQLIPQIEPLMKHVIIAMNARAKELRGKIVAFKQ